MSVVSRLAPSLAIVVGGFGHSVVALVSYWWMWDASCTTLNDMIYYSLFVLALGGYGPTGLEPSTIICHPLWGVQPGYSRRWRSKKVPVDGRDHQGAGNQTMIVVGFSAKIC